MNSALNLLKHIGGTAAIMSQQAQEKKDIADFVRKDEKANPKQRIAQPLRSYLKRYRNNLAEYIRHERTVIHYGE